MNITSQTYRLRCRNGWGMPTLPPRGSMIADRADLRRARRLRWSIERATDKPRQEPHIHRLFGVWFSWYDSCRYPKHTAEVVTARVSKTKPVFTYRFVPEAHAKP